MSRGDGGGRGLDASLERSRHGRGLTAPCALSSTPRAGWAAPRLKHLSLELGGHGPLIALPDADVATVVDVAVSQGYANAGQACYSVNRVLALTSTARRAWRQTARSGVALPA